VPEVNGSTARADVDLLGLTRELVDIASESHHEGPITEYIDAMLRAVPWLDVQRDGFNLVARTSFGRAQRVILAGHTDTVAINANHPARVDGDMLWGCGSADMKSGLAVMLALATSPESAALDATYVFYEAEEAAAPFNGLAKLFAEHPEWLRGDVALLGEPTSAGIEAGCQGTVRLEITFDGERAHTARPWMGRNAIHRMGAALARVAAYVPRRPVIDGCEFHEALQAVHVTGGVSGNVVPDQAVLTVNHRFAPDRTGNDAVEHVYAVLGDTIGDGDRVAVVDLAAGAAPGLHHELLAALVTRNALEVRSKLGWTDVARFAEHGVPATNFGPGDATLAHTRDERVDRASIERVYAAVRDLLTRGA
jgi:succinyl-diaminopimelate desuccinylase